MTKSEIEMLVAGETVSKEIYEDLTYNRLMILWNISGACYL